MKRLTITWGDTVIVDEDMSKADWSDAEATITVVGHRTRRATPNPVGGGGLGGLLTQLAAARPKPERPVVVEEETPEITVEEEETPDGNA